MGQDQEPRGLRVVVTAGAGGIGKAIAQGFADAGASIAVCDIDDVALQAIDRGGDGLIAYRADVTDEAQMAGFFGTVEAAWGGADVVVANAGVGGPTGGIGTLDYEDWRACIAGNLDSAFLASRWAARVLTSAGSGLLLLMSSTAGFLGYPERSPYAAAKWGVIGLMKTLAMELGPHGVRVNALCPGAVEGPRMDRVVAHEARARGESEATTRRRYVENASMKTWVTAADIANAALFLASPAGAKISGQALAVDGHTFALT